MHSHTAPAPATVLEVRLLGGFTLLREGIALSIATSLQRLVAFLALRGPTPRPHAAGLLWPSTPDEKALASLRTAVWRLRGIAPGLLSDDAGALRLSPGVSVDVTRLEAGTDLALVRGLAARPWADLLPGWYDDWVIMEQERSRHRYLRLLESAAAAAVDDGDHAAALDWALSAAAVDPMRESAHRLVVQALLAVGNVDAARRHLAFVRRIFLEHLGLAPSPQLTALFQRAGTGRRPTNPAPRTRRPLTAAVTVR